MLHGLLPDVGVNKGVMKIDVLQQDSKISKNEFSRIFLYINMCLLQSDIVWFV